MGQGAQMPAFGLTCLLMGTATTPVGQVPGIGLRTSSSEAMFWEACRRSKQIIQTIALFFCYDCGYFLVLLVSCSELMLCDIWQGHEAFQVLIRGIIAIVILFAHRREISARRETCRKYDSFIVRHEHLQMLVWSHHIKGDNFNSHHHICLSLAKNE